MTELAQGLGLYLSDPLARDGEVLADFLAPLPALVSAAEATTHLRVGTNVLNNDFRHPVLVAREAATVDLLTDGRLQLGLGAGFMQAEYDQLGVHFDTGGRRVERLAEAVRIIKGLCTGQPITFVGQHYHVTRHQLQPLPVQRPHPPLLIGGNGLRLLTMAAQEADIVGLTGITFRPGGQGPELSGWTVAATNGRSCFFACSRIRSLTRDPSRRKACAISNPIGPPPMTIKCDGKVRFEDVVLKGKEATPAKGRKSD